MSAPPRLSESDIRVEVERIFRKDHRSQLVALYGRGEPGRFDLDGSPWEVIPTRCELDLREKLPHSKSSQAAGRVFLVDWEEEALPLDVACRLAGGRLFHIARDARLAALFGARQVDTVLLGGALAKLLLSGAVEGLKKVSGLRLTKDEAWRRFLNARLGVTDDVLADATSLFKWGRRSEAGPAFLRQSETDEAWRAVRRELHDWIGEKLGPVGVLAWRAWESSQIDRVLQVMALWQVGQAADDAYLRGLLGGQLGAWLMGLAPEFRAAQSSLADGALLESLVDPSSEADRRLLDEAQALATAGGVAAACNASPWLAAGHTAREQTFAQRLDEFVQESSTDRLAAVRAGLEQLAAHRLDSTLRGTEHVEARLMAARLCTWLLARKVRPSLAKHTTVWQPAVDLSRRYAEEGGYVDWARQTLRGLRGATAPLESAVRGLLGKVEAEAREDDRRFAEAYVSWLEAGKPSTDVVPIEHVAKRLVASFLRDKAHRKLLVVVMDGMSQASAMQVLNRLQEQRRWKPLAWRAPGWRGVLPIPPVLAAAPTLTDVSRSALFAGTADPRFGDQGTDRDEARWSSNPHLKDVLGEEPTAVFFRRDLLAGHELIDDVKTAVAGDNRVVAVVVNAIDEQLKGSIQVGGDYSHKPILPLDALLSAAEGADRAVLLVADHGHVQGDAMRVVSGRVAGDRQYGARWRGLTEGEHPEPDEVRLPDTCWKPRRAAGVAVLWNTSVAFKAPHYGEHGGLSLMETVAPAILIGPEWLDRAVGVEDPDLETRPMPVPDWWDLRVPRAAAAATSPIATMTVPVAQLTLIPVTPTPTTQVATQATEASLVVSLRASKAFREHVRGQPERELELVLGWLSVLVQSEGTLSAADFAHQCGVRAHQVGGAVARMGIVLNADGFAIVEHDVTGRRVILHKARLIQQYGAQE